MTNPILDALVLYSGAGFLFYRAWILHDFSRCLPASVITVAALTAWPFFVPMSICLIAIYVIALIFLPFLKAKKLLKKKNVIWSYSILALVGLAYALARLFSGGKV